MIGVALLVTLCFHCCTGLIGGDYATEHQFPYNVAIMNFQYINPKPVSATENPRVIPYLKCGGNIIHPLWVLTADHCCLDIYPPQECAVRAGVNNLKFDGIWRAVTKIEYSNSVALVSFENPLLLSKVVQPIALVTEEIPDNSDLVIAGWGLRSCYFGSMSETSFLKYNWLKSVSHSKCRKMHKKFDKSDVICVASTKYNYGPLTGDDGAGAVYKNKLFGIYLFRAFDCPDYEKPFGFVKISSYAQWIQETITNS